jgi:hypothetical protein
MITYLRMSSAWHKGNGRARVPGSLAGDGEAAAGGQDLLDVPGHVSGPEPPVPRDRSLVTVAVLAAAYRPDQLISHLRLALANGLTRDELVEALTHLAFYAGWPSGMAVLTQLKTITADTSSGASGYGEDLCHAHVWPGTPSYARIQRRR